MVINGMEADKYLCEQACQGHGGDGRELASQSERDGGRESTRTDTFSSSWQLILIPSSVSSIPKWNHPSLISPPPPRRTCPPLIRPPAYSTLPELPSFPWLHRIKRVTSRLNQRFWSAENITSSFESCSLSSGWYSFFLLPDSACVSPSSLWENRQSSKLEGLSVSVGPKSGSGTFVLSSLCFSVVSAFKALYSRCPSNPLCCHHGGSEQNVARALSWERS